MSDCRKSGFTLVEMVIVIALSGIIAAVVAVFLRAPLQQYADLTRRAELTDAADSAVRRMARDLRHALPNSVRLSGAGGCAGAGACTLEFIPTVGGGRYRIGSGDPLDFHTADTSFDVVGPMPPATTAHHVVIYNLGIDGADAYQGRSTHEHVRRPVAGAPSAGKLSITSTARFPFESPGQRFFIVEPPVRYVCDPTTGTLTRETSGWPEAPTAVTSHLMAQHVTQCRFTYDQTSAVAAQRAGLVTMHLSLADSGESVTLYHAVHVSNQP